MELLPSMPHAEGFLTVFPWERCGIDTSGNQEHFLDRVQDAIQAHNKKNEHKIIVPLVGLKDSLNKKTRIETALQPLVAGGLIKVRSDSKKLKEQLEQFPYGQNRRPRCPRVCRKACADFGDRA